MNIFLDYRSRTPIYEQIKEQIILSISRGQLKADEQLPSLRQLSAELSININTVKRAFAELEDQGITYSVAGKGIFVSGVGNSVNIYSQQALKVVKSAVINAKALGVEKEELAEIINDIYKGDEISD